MPRAAREGSQPIRINYFEDNAAKPEARATSTKSAAAHSDTRHAAVKDSEWRSESEGKQRRHHRASSSGRRGERRKVAVDSRRTGLVVRDAAEERERPCRVDPHTLPKDVPEQYVAKSSFCSQNPFRLQTFTDFTISPNYAPPPHLKRYTAVTVGSRALQTVKIDSIQAIKEQFKRAFPTSYTPGGSSRIEDMLIYLCAGEWFWKWDSRSNTRKRRYFWLNGNKCALMWSVSQSVLSFSQLNLRSVVKTTSDCITVGEKVIYRMKLCAENTLVFGTEHRILFDQWYAVLRYIISPNSEHGVPGLWKRPSVLRTNTGGDWSSRYSPLHTELTRSMQGKTALSTAWTD